jgi:hypothetical protein
MDGMFLCACIQYEFQGTHVHRDTVVELKNSGSGEDGDTLFALSIGFRVASQRVQFSLGMRLSIYLSSV